MAVAGIVGGATSSALGGDFAAGAFSAAFARQFNDEEHIQQYKKALQKSIDSLKAVGANLFDEVEFGINAVKSGIQEDYENGGLREVVIGATGGHTNESFRDQFVSNYQSTSIIAGPLSNIDRTIVSLASGSAIASRYDGYTFGQLLLKGPAPHLGTYAASARLAAISTGINAVIVTTAYEGGNFAGSLIRTTTNSLVRQD